MQELRATEHLSTYSSSAYAVGGFMLKCDDGKSVRASAQTLATARENHLESPEEETNHWDTK